MSNLFLMLVIAMLGLAIRMVRLVVLHRRLQSSLITECRQKFLEVDYFKIKLAFSKYDESLRILLTSDEFSQISMKHREKIIADHYSLTRRSRQTLHLFYLGILLWLIGGFIFIYIKHYY